MENEIKIGLFTIVKDGDKINSYNPADEDVFWVYGQEDINKLIEFLQTKK